ncbi:MAG TPA: hypothetical protein PLK94_14005, partial [Alphaproteobacteria bacterium]|nr:hypothetical protein [Alphaproteobacteria bacterium]
VRFQRTGLFPFSQNPMEWDYREYFETMEILSGSYKVTKEETQQGIEELRRRIKERENNGVNH